MPIDRRKKPYIFPRPDTEFPIMFPAWMLDPSLLPKKPPKAPPKPERD